MCVSSSFLSSIFSLFICDEFKCHFMIFFSTFISRRCAKWVQNSRRKDLLGKSPMYLYHNCRLCSKHFEDNQILSTGRLVWNAVPTKFDVPNPPKQITPKRKLPTRCESDQPKAKRFRGMRS